jgi:hypothetical protein
MAPSAIATETVTAPADLPVRSLKHQYGGYKELASHKLDTEAELYGKADFEAAKVRVSSGASIGPEHF